jgi:hypothetical protein
MSKRIAAIVLAVTFISLAVAPETQAQRFRRDCNRSAVARSYGAYPYSGVAGQRYYSSPYYNGGVSRYNAQPYYGRVAGTRYYGPYREYRDRNSTRNAVLTVAGPAAVGAGVGAIMGGGKGAGIGALIGGGGGAVYYLLRNRNRRY